MPEHEGLPHGASRTFFTKKLLDTQRNPPEFIYEEAPTRTIKLGHPLGGQRYTMFRRSPAGTVQGSLRIIGSSQRQAGAPGTFSLRITRLSLAISGTSQFGRGTEYRWFIRHSRTGTADVKLLNTDTQQIFQVGGPSRPIYAFGPGSVIWGFLGDHLSQVGSHVTFHQSMEGVVT